jgi:hypothetical protein
MKRKSAASLLSIVVLLAITVLLYGCANGSNDPKTLIIGKWSHDSDDTFTVFSKDGIVSLVDENGDKIQEDETYTVEKKDDKSIIIKTKTGTTITAVFKDNNTFEADGVTCKRVSENKNSSESTKTTDAAKSPKTLIIGKWTSAGDSIEFNKNGKATVTEDGQPTQYTFKLETIAGSTDSIKITLIDSDNTSSSETAVFSGANTMVIGDTTFNRAK